MSIKGFEGLQAKASKANVAEALVHSFMSKNPVSILTGTKIYVAIQTLATHKIGSAPVVNGQGQIVGVISEHDLLIQTATRDVLDSIEYVKDPITVTPDMALKDLLILLYKKKIRRIPVVEKNRTIVGMVTRIDVLLKLIGKT